VQAGEEAAAAAQRRRRDADPHPQPPAPARGAGRRRDRELDVDDVEPVGGGGPQDAGHGMGGDRRRERGGREPGVHVEDLRRLRPRHPAAAGEADAAGVVRRRPRGRRRPPEHDEAQRLTRRPGPDDGEHLGRARVVRCRPAVGGVGGRATGVTAVPDEVGVHLAAAEESPRRHRTPPGRPERGGPVVVGEGRRGERERRRPPGARRPGRPARPQRDEDPQLAGDRQRHPGHRGRLRGGARRRVHERQRDREDHRRQQRREHQPVAGRGQQPAQRRGVRVRDAGGLDGGEEGEGRRDHLEVGPAAGAQEEPQHRGHEDEVEAAGEPRRGDQVGAGDRDVGDGGRGERPAAVVRVRDALGDGLDHPGPGRADGGLAAEHRRRRGAAPGRREEVRRVGRVAQERGAEVVERAGPVATDRPVVRERLAERVDPRPGKVAEAAGDTGRGVAGAPAVAGTRDHRVARQLRHQHRQMLGRRWCRHLHHQVGGRASGA
jgi:hypothetical protein